MKLLSINNYHYRRGGADIAFLLHDRMFRNLGWETAVFAMQHPDNLPTPWQGYFVEEIERGRTYRAWDKISMAGKVIYSVEARRKLTRLLGNFAPDIAHAHCIYHHISPSVLPLLKQRGIPTVLTAHDLKLACPAYRMFNGKRVCEACKHGNLLNVVAHRCIHGSIGLSSLIAVESAIHKILGLYRSNLDRVVVPSRFFRTKLVEWGWPAERIIYIPNFVNAGIYEPRFEPGKYFLYFGRLSREKGILTLLEAARACGVELKVIGDGPERSAVQALVETSPRIELHHHLDGAELREHIRHARAVVLPSEWYENAPLSLLEAFACGKPVIGARIGGIPELVTDNETGLLFSSGVRAELEHALATVDGLSAERLRQLGRNAREFVAREFTEKRYLAKMLDLYRSLGVGSVPDGGDRLPR